MTPGELLEAIETVSDGPDGVDRLRSLVLSLAMSGGLTSSSFDEEGEARELLAEIRQTLRAEGIERRRDKPPTASQVSTPPAAPQHWVWCRIGDICPSMPQRVPATRFTYIDVSAIDNQNGRITDSLEVLYPDQAPSRARKIVERDCVIYSTVRPYLRNIAIVDRDFSPTPIVSTAFAVIKAVCGVSPRFIYYYLRSPQFVTYVESKQKGVAYPAINDGDFFAAPFPLAPLAEQRRIVAKVDELMALLDELERARDERDARRAAFRDSALAALRNAEDADAARAAWSRIVANLPECITDPADIAPLRQTILQLAVRGRLVPRDPADEPAEALLERIKKEKSELVEAKKLRQAKPLAEIDSQALPFDLPAGWCWSRIGDYVLEVTDGVHKTPTYVDRGVPFLSIKDISGGKIEFSNTRFITPEAHREMCKRCKPERGDILFCRIGTLGQPVVIESDQEFSLFVSVGLLKMPDAADPYFLKIAMGSPFAYVQYDSIKAGGSHTNKLNLGAMRSAVMPIPPLAEQHRIVAKVDELMAICDELEQRLTEARAHQSAFAAAAVHHLDLAHNKEAATAV